MRAAAMCLFLAGGACADVIYCRATLLSGADDGSSWENALRGPLALQRALSSARPGDEIWLAQGAYKPAAPNGPVTSTFRLIPGVSVRGGFAGGESTPAERTPGHETVLSGDLNGNGNRDAAAADNADRLAIGVGLDASTVLDRLTFTGGVGDFSGEVNRNLGSGLLLLGGSPTVRGCTFRDNSTEWMGGGAAVEDASAVFEDCVFDGNHAHSGHNLASLGSSLTAVRRCRFIGDSRVTGGSAGIGILSGSIIPDPADHPVLIVEDTLFSMAENPFSCPSGMGIYASQGTADVRRCDFINNRTCGGGGGIAGDASVVIDRCRFIGNEAEADGGAALHTFDGSYTVTNSLFHGNDRNGFATVYAGGVFRAVNCTFTNNGSTGGIGGGGFHFVIMTQRPGSSVENCVFWGNQSRGGTLAAVADATDPPRFDRCLVQGWSGSLPGAGSFAAEPLFTDWDGADGVAGNTDDDLRPAAGSPMIDRGSNAAMARVLDLDGRPRFRDDPAAPDRGVGPPPQIDLGAYERQVPCRADFNRDGFLDFFDYDAFVVAFEQGSPETDINGDGFLDFFDYDEFVGLFQAGC